MSFNTLDNILINLKIIGKIKAEDRLSTKKGILSFEPKGYFQFIRRWYHADSRTSAVEYIKSVVDQINEIITQKEINITSNMNERIKNTISNDIQHAIKGLENFKLTYKNDVSLQAKIDILIDKLLIQSEILNHHKPNKTNKLKESNIN